MRLVVQRVDSAKVEVNKNIVGEINKGLLVYLGIGKEDSEKDIDFLVNKVVNLRIFEDANQKMNLSILDIHGEILIVSQFTLYGDIKKGMRPNFQDAAAPELAEKLYNDFVEKIKLQGLKIQTGVFREMMKVTSINDGPVTILGDTQA